MKETLRTWRGVLRHAPDRMAHPLRRLWAQRGIGTNQQASVLFICQGNICRSPFAAALFNQLTADRTFPTMRATSAGFIGPGRAPPPAALAAAARRGVDLSTHRSALVTGRMTRDATTVVVMSVEQARSIRRIGGAAVRPLLLGDLDPLPILTRTVIDPWGCDDAVFDDSYARIDRCVRELIRLMAEVGVHSAAL